MHKIASQFLTRSFLRQTIIFLLIISVVFVLFFWQLGTLTPAYSPDEKDALSQSGSLSNIVTNPVFMPHKFLQYGLSFLSDSSVWARLPSVLMSLVALGCFYVISRRWFGKMVAVLSTLLFASLPWFILISRNATPDVMYLSSLLLIAATVWLPLTERKVVAFFGISLAAIFCAYTPGLIWFLIPAAYLWRHKIKEGAQDVGKLTPVGAFLIFLLGLSPLGWAALQNVDVLKSILLIPNEYPALIESVKGAGWSILSFVWATKESHPMILGTLPLLTISAIALSVFGIYIMWKRARAELIGLLILLLVATTGYALNQNMAILTIAFPAFGILTAAGLRFLYAEWRSIFPLNPIPKSLAIFLVVGLVMLNMMYGIRYALAAWPNNQTTKSTYVLK